MEIAKASYQSSERRYDMLRAELQRRKKQEATGPEAVKNQTEEG